jgi:hypothetical protein
MEHGSYSKASQNTGHSVSVDQNNCQATYLQIILKLFSTAVKKKSGFVS